MSADNGFVLRKVALNKYALQEYSASEDEYPAIERAVLIFDTVEAAVCMFEEIESDPSYMVEYGLTVRIKGVTPPTEKENTVDEILRS